MMKDTDNHHVISIQAVVDSMRTVAKAAKPGMKIGFRRTDHWTIAQQRKDRPHPLHIVERGARAERRLAVSSNIPQIVSRCR
jgi:hypothetical protein